MKIFRLSNSNGKHKLKDSIKHVKCFSSQFLENEISSLKKEIERKNSFLEFYEDRTKKIRVKIDSRLKNYLGDSTHSNLKNTISQDMNLSRTPLILMNNKLRLSSNENCLSNREENLKVQLNHTKKQILSERSSNINEKNQLSFLANSSNQSYKLPNSKKRKVVNEAEQKDTNDNSPISKKDLTPFTRINSRLRKLSLNLIKRSSSEVNEGHLVNSISSLDKNLNNEFNQERNNNRKKTSDEFLRVDMLYNKIFNSNLAVNLGLDLGNNKPKIPIENKELNNKLYRIKHSTFYLKSIVDYSYNSIMSEKIKIIKENLKKIKQDKEVKTKSKEIKLIDKKETTLKTDKLNSFRSNVKSLTISKFPTSCKLKNIRNNKKMPSTTIDKETFTIFLSNQSNVSQKKLVPIKNNHNISSNKTQL